MTLTDELAEAKRRLSHLILNPLPINGWTVEDHAQFTRELENMEGQTRFMPLTRLCLDRGEIQYPVALIVEEITSMIAKIRPSHPFVANHRHDRMWRFVFNPTIPNLRAIWLIREVRP